LRKKRNKRCIENGNNNNNNNNNNIRAHYTKQSVYTHTHKKMAKKRTNLYARIKYLQLFCVTQYFLFLHVYVWKRKEEEKNTVGNLAIGTKKKQEKCLERITNLNTQVK
jgi:hypothetical protein